jgi:hypothetical protein
LEIIMKREFKLAGRSSVAELALVLATVLASLLSFGSVVALYASAEPGERRVVARVEAVASAAAAAKLAAHRPG